MAAQKKPTNTIAEKAEFESVQGTRIYKELAEPIQGEGTVVRDLSVEKLVQPPSSILLVQHQLAGNLLEFREMIEPALAGPAAVNCSLEEDVARLEEIYLTGPGLGSTFRPIHSSGVLHSLFVPFLF